MRFTVLSEARPLSEARRAERPRPVESTGKSSKGHFGQGGLYRGQALGLRDPWPAQGWPLVWPCQTSRASGARRYRDCFIVTKCCRDVAWFSPKLAFRECKFRRKTIQPERFPCILDRQVKAEPPYAAAPSMIAARRTWRGARSVSFYDSFWAGTPQRAQPTDCLSSKRQGTKRMDGC